LDAPPLDGLPGDVAEGLHDGGDQGLLCVARGAVDIPATYSAHKILQWINITRAKRLRAES